jgi:hypothetical protein
MTAFGSTGEDADFAGKIFLVAVAVAIAAFLVVEVYDLDVWWNVVIGRDILATLSVPKVDRYTTAGLGHSYQDIHWLFQVAAALAERAGGWSGVVVLQVAIWSVALAFCYRAARRWASREVSAALVFLAAMACVERFLPRPEIVTCVMMAVFYARLQAGRYRSVRDLALLAALQIVWANAHGLFVIGPFMAGCYLIEEVARGRRSEARPPAVLFAVLLVCSVFTPHGAGSWEYAWLLITQVGPSASNLMRSLGELSPTFGAASRSGTAFWFFLALLVVTVAAIAVRRRVSIARLLIVTGMAVAACSGRRNVVLFALVAAPFAAEQMAMLRFPRPAIWAASALVLAWAAFPLSGRYYLFMQIPARFGLGLTPSFFPHSLPAYLDRIGFTGQVYNSNTIGGFYLFHGFPKRLPLSEGRWTAYDEETVTRILHAPKDPALWNWVLNTYKINALLLHHASPEARDLVPRLPRDARWRLVWFDYAASLWVRSDLPGAPPTLDLEHAPPLPPPPRVDDCIIANIFFRAVGAVDSRIRNLEQMASFGWKREMFMEELGQLQTGAKRHADAERTYHTLVTENPRNASAYNELAYLAVLRGDTARAEAMLQQALTLDPNNRDYQANMARLHSARK